MKNFIFRLKCHWSLFPRVQTLDNDDADAGDDHYDYDNNDDDDDYYL